MHGILDAETLPLALDALRRQGVIPFVAQPADSKRAGGWLRLGQASKGTSLAWRAQFIQQCATLLAAGIPLDRTLGIIESQAPAGHRKRLLGNIRDAVNAGQSLSAALAIGEAGFQPDETGLVKAGEQTGSLVPVLVDLGAALERRQELRGRIISTLIYPAFLLGLAPLSWLLFPSFSYRASNPCSKAPTPACRSCCACCQPSRQNCTNAPCCGWRRRCCW